MQASSPRVDGVSQFCLVYRQADVVPWKDVLHHACEGKRCHVAVEVRQWLHNAAHQCP